MTSSSRTQLSVLDISSIDSAGRPADTLVDTRRLVAAADELGYARFWVAEHHNSRGIAGSVPAVLLAALGERTTRIRIGAGGVILPNHAPYAVAESFRTLAALFPGRVDLGIGRSGADPVLAHALRRAPDEDFPAALEELLGFVGGGFPDGHVYQRLEALPEPPQPPRVWLLGASVRSAVDAGRRGLPYAFAHHFFNSRGTEEALRAYRESFRPSSRAERPHAIVTAYTVCGETAEQARRLTYPALFPVLRLNGASPTAPLPTVEEAAAYPWTDAERAAADALLSTQAVGDADEVRRALADLLERTGADELMVTNNVTDVDEKIRSLERVRELAESLPVPAGVTS
ncbi:MULTISPECIES: LLM class flavin-dependent oxidoreductase [unclassified Streptomyces]|uniref:LLM class flavin-dependent oxidoreductase n=1 Tax=Streptomycetaceae TaxID=2062 RepID=UPI002E77F4C4|nr:MULTISPECIES: LLM class flavin-dependent oxidoreductase [unclassified Streptomyces]MED7955237.1 LLM class flavin-dependent oxidoreductase [Streptomyces sp. BE303]MEE1825419.1 LLM class flavin-dependent oxidoreductase [Streptomyces sp. BE20]